MFCHQCGQSLSDGQPFCPNCGARQSNSQEGVPADQPVSQTSPVTSSALPAAIPKKKRRGLKGLIIAIVIIGALALGLSLLLPGLFSPKDLGVSSSEEAYQSLLVKLNYTKDTSPETGVAEDYLVVYGPPVAVNTSLTSEEITSFFNENRPDYYALKDVQVRINDDNTLDFSANLDTNYVFSEILGDSYSREDAKDALPMLGLLPQKVNIYCNAGGSVEDNQIRSFSLNDVSIMGIGIPDSLIQSEQASAFIVSTLDGYMQKYAAASGNSFDSLKMENGELQFSGQTPSSVTRSAK